MESLSQAEPQMTRGYGELPTSPEYARVEQRVIRQLIQGLVFENVLPVIETETAGPPGVRRLTITGHADDGDEVRYVCLGSRKASFGRVRLAPSSVQRLAPDGRQADATLAGFLTEVMAGIVPVRRFPAFMDELQQTLLKDAQSRVLSGMPMLPDPSWDHDAWEGRLHEGHPYHPSYKSRIGFTLADNAEYGPEFQRDIRPVWLAIAVEQCRISVSASIQADSFLREELGEAVWQRFRKTLIEQGKQPQDYVFLPVHPWQWSRSILINFHAELAAGHIVYLGQANDVFRAQQSIRTLANASCRDKAYLKLALSITNTSTSRILAAHTVHNSARISDWLHDLIVRDDEARQMGVVILREVLGVAYDDTRLAESRRPLIYGTLGAVWRESLHRYLQAGERALAFNGLTQLAASDVPMIDGWIRQYGVTAWTQQLLDVTVAPLIHMLYAHGIGLEAHGQNILLIHRNGWPERIALKDFHDGVRYCVPLLAEPERAPELVPEPASHAAVNRNSYIQTDDADDVRDFTYDAFVFICLTELCLCLEQHYGLEEADFWAMAADVIHTYQAAHPALAERFELFDLFAETVNIEELTKRRLFGDGEKRFTTRANPLHPFRMALGSTAC